jgi:hypothetical protein
MHLILEVSLVQRLAKVKDILPLTDGLFAHIDYQFWDFDASELDLLLLSRCGQRLPAPLLDIIQGQPDDPCAVRPRFTDSQLAQLGQLILRTYQFKWDKLGGLHAVEYDILKNYLDEYEEVMQDDDSSSLSKSANRAERAFETSQLASSTGSTVTQQTENSSETESIRKDDFSSDFTRASTDNTNRTDNLSEAKTEAEDTDITRTDNLSESINKTEDSTVTRTDNLLDSGEHSNTDSQSHQGGNYTEQVTRELTSTGGQDGSTGVYGFNSSQPVGDSTSEVDTTASENETTTKVISGTKSDSLSRSGSDEVSHTGTQETVTDGEGTSNKSNTGTQATVTDTDKSSIKLNTGNQTVTETVSITDSTVNTENQVDTTTSGGTSSASNESSQRAASSNDTTSGSTSQLAEDSVINRALNRARKYTHKGNIGNLTPQQLIKQEIDLWRWNFIEEVLNDVKNFITIPIYS